MSDDIEPHVTRKFEISQRLGKGAYGVVWKAVDRRTRAVVALKKCFDAFRNHVDAQRTFREIMYLQALSGHENIIRLQHVLKSEHGKDIYLTFDYMPTDLHSVIRSKILIDIHMKYIIWQLLKALKYLHSASLLHRDIKPSNILLNAECHIKLCDFGLCRSIAELNGPAPELTDYVATRWYRAPEILLGSKTYTHGIDIWAVGLILGEMINSKPVFPGLNAMNQLERIISVIRMPSPTDISSIPSQFTATMLGALDIPESSYKSIAEIFPKASPEALEFIRTCFQFNPYRRPTSEALLGHAYVADFHNVNDEPEYPHGALTLPIDDNTRLTEAQYRERIYLEIANRNKMVRKKNSEQQKQQQLLQQQQQQQQLQQQQQQYTQAQVQGAQGGVQGSVQSGGVQAGGVPQGVHQSQPPYATS